MMMQQVLVDWLLVAQFSQLSFLFHVLFLDHQLQRRFVVQLQQLFELYEERGSDAALDHMLNDEVHGDEFAHLFETYKDERRLGSPLWSASDAASFVVKSKEAFDDQELAIVALLPGNPYDLVSFGIPWAFYGGQ